MIFFQFQQGFIHTNDEEYFIEPLKNDPLTPEGHHRHVIYKRSALPKHLDPLRAALDRHRRDADEDDSCGVKGKHTCIIYVTKSRQSYFIHRQ